MMKKAILLILAGGLLSVACGGVIVASKATAQTERYMREALSYKAQADGYRAKLAVAKGQLADAERRIAACRGKPVQVRCEVGRAGTLSRSAKNYVNVKAPSDHYWRGQIGRDRHKHAIFKSPEWSLRAGAIVLKNYAKRHDIHTIEGIVKRFSTSNHKEYISFLCKRLGLKPDEKFSIVGRMHELLPAMVKFETGAKVAPEHIAILDYLKES